MILLALFLCNYLLFSQVYRELTGPDAKYSPGVRLLLSTVVLFFGTLVTLWLNCTAGSLIVVAAAAAAASIDIRGEGLSRLTDALGRGRFVLYILSVATLAALACIFVPITTFMTSPGELSIHLDYLLSVNAHDAMVVVYVSALVYALAISSRMRTILTAVAFSALLVGLIYSYVLPFGYPMMSGLAFEQLPTPVVSLVLRLLVDVLLLIAIVLLVPTMFLRYGARPAIVGVLLVNVSLLIAAAIGIHGDRIGQAGDVASSSAQRDQPLRFSKTKHNVLVVFLDRFMGSYVESILQSDPDLAERLSGFTWYPRSVSAGENSIAGIHPMLGGYDYTPVAMNARGKPLREQSVEAFSILPYNFSRRGYRVNMVNPRGLGFTMNGDCEYLKMERVFCTHISHAVAKQRAQQMGFPLDDLSTANYADLLVLLGSMRVAPYGFKEVLYRVGPWRPFLNHVAGTTFTEWAELDALDELSSTAAEEPNFNFVNNILPHEPYYMGEDCMPKGERLQMRSEEWLKRGHISIFSLQHAVAARCALLAVANYLDFLKSAGVYDNTTIAIVSDHGIVGPVEDTSSRAVAGGTQDNIYVRTRPLMLVKEIGAKGPLRISEDFMPNADMPRLVCKDIGGCVNPYLGNKTIEAHGRDDPFNVSLVPWQFSAQNRDSFVVGQQRVLRGKDPFSAKNWKVIE